ncbi:hemolymph lipopolysaccharide-binding protein-like [Hetaerina americana]|uniref:hemolymph lipopolysaccharide-binding protein-like n=1 Tax=Hetaerina americana TaxID=62018 RepID=UPI003A7F180D
MENPAMHFILLLVSIFVMVGGEPVTWNEPFSNCTMEFSMSSRKNETGHYVTDFSLSKTSTKLPKYWRLNLEHNTIESGGIQTFRLRGLIVAHPAVPAGYELFHGIGYYRFHKELKSFDDASAVCAAEGGHLAIMNSEAEHQVIKTLFGRHPEAGAWAFVGVHDRLKEGEFVTIFGQPLASTGFNKWFSAHEPNGGIRENCCTVANNGLLNDGSCDSKLPFFCEYDLSWTDI